MFRHPRLTFVAVLTATILCPSLTSAAEIYHYRAQGTIAAGSFFDIDSTGCLWTYADFSVTEGRIRNEPGLGEPSTGLVLFIYQFDRCQGNYLTEKDLYVNAVIPADALRVQGALRSVSVQATVEVENRWTGTTQPAVIDMTWTGEGEISRGHSHSQSQIPGGRSIWRSFGSFRSATPSGSITLPSMTLTGADGVYGRLESGQSASMIIYNRPH